MSPKATRSKTDATQAGPPPVAPDEILVAAALAGRESAFDELLSRHRPAAVKVAARIVGPGRAEDVTRDAVKLARKALPSLKDRTKFSRWLMALTRWKALRAGRLACRKAFGRGVMAEEPILETLSHLACDPRHTVEGDEILLAALDCVPAEYAEVIRYHFLHGMSQQKVADLLGIPLATVKWCCFRGKEILRCILSPEPRAPRCVRMKASCIQEATS
jgi:RNA polymerase sigma factor (sigma-70 family)